MSADRHYWKPDKQFAAGIRIYCSVTFLGLLDLGLPRKDGGNTVHSIGARLIILLEILVLQFKNMWSHKVFPWLEIFAVMELEGNSMRVQIYYITVNLKQVKS